MDKERITEIIKKTLLFLLAVVMIVWGYHSNEQYKQTHGMEQDGSSGASQSA